MPYPFCLHDPSDERDLLRRDSESEVSNAAGKLENDDEHEVVLIPSSSVCQ